MSVYRHGTYGEFVNSIGSNAANGSTIAVYVGVAPVNLIRGYKNFVNSPVKLSSLEDAQNYCGYSDNWAAFDLCEAFAWHFNNPMGNIGPVVAINVLDPDTHKKEQATTQAVTFTNGRGFIKSDTVILDTLAVADKVEGTDYSLSYDFAKGQVIIESIGEAITGSVSVTFSEVDPSAVTAEEIIGDITDEGVYSGLGCVALVYPELGVVPNIILAPGWSEKPAVYKEMLSVAANVNGHWNAVAYADIPVKDDTAKIDTITKAITWKGANGYTGENSKVFWPKGMDTKGRVCHASVAAAWATMLTDNNNGGIPMESPSNKALPIVKQYFGEDSTNRGFDQNHGNQLNEKGITTIVFWGGQWVLWGPHTAAFEHGNDDIDQRVRFDNTIRMLMYVSNSFQADWAQTIDSPMTRQLADTIKVREQEKVDALAAMGAFIGSPVVDFKQSENTVDNLVKGHFVWGFEGTTTPPFKSGTLKISYTDAGFASYFGEV